MKKRHVAAVVLTASLALTGWNAAFAQNPAPAPAPAPATGGGLQVLTFRPGMDDVMTMMVQPRHIKLAYAVRDKNWELAQFEWEELQASFRRIGEYIPVYRTKDVKQAVTIMLTPNLNKVEDAIKAKDAAQFATAYKALTDSCNTCHAATEHPFIIVKVPATDGPNLYPNQEFAPRK